MASNLDQFKQINKVIAERQAMLEKQTSELSKQVDMAVAIGEALKGASTGDIAKKVDDVNKALQAAAQSAQNFNSSSQSMARSISTGMLRVVKPIDVVRDKILDLTTQWPTLSAAVLGFVDGLVSSFKLIGNSFKAVINFSTTAAASFIDISSSIAHIPFKMFEGLVAVANRLAPIMQAIATATEEVRKQFGDLSTTAGKSVMDTVKNMQREFKGMNLTAYSAFGNTAERIQYVNKVATEMGATFEQFQGEIGDTKAEILLMQKGLGLTGEDMGMLAQRAKAFGTTLGAQMTTVSKVSTDFSKRFGLSQKLISRDIGQMVKDVKNFGSLSPTELGKISVYARKLGVDFKELLGIVDKFDTFEDAAVSAAKLSQAFGANIDAIAMMKEQDPAKRIDMLRQAFFATGKSAEQLNRQELKLLQQNTGLSEATLKVALSHKNAGVSMMDLEKQGQITEKRQISQAEATQQLTNSIERIIKPFLQFKGFLDAAANGFGRGVMQGKPFLAMFTALYNALRQTYRIGIQVGEAFDAVFPGVGELAQQLTDLFKIDEKHKGFSKFLTGVKGDFIDFFKTVGGEDGRFSLPNLMKKLNERFFDYFVPGESKSNKLLSSFTKFTKAMGNIVAGGIKVVSEGIVRISEVIASLMTGKSLPTSDPTGLMNTFFTPIQKAIQESWPMVKTALVNVFYVVWDKVKPELVKLWDKAGPWIAGTIFGVGLSRSLMAVAATVVPQLIVRSLVGAEGNVAGAVGKWGKKRVSKDIGDAIAENIMNISKPVEAAGGFASKFGKAGLVGLGLIALAIPVLGTVAALTLKLIDVIGVPKDIGPTIDAMTGLFKGVALMLIPAAILGAPMLIPGVGLVGALTVGAMVGVGAAMLGAFAAVLIGSMLPAIRMIASVEVKDPAAMTATTNAVVSVLDVVNKFASSVASIVSAVSPGVFGFLKGDTFSSNMDAVKSFVDSMVKNGFGAIIQRVIDLSAGFAGQPEKLEAAKVIAGVFQSITSFAGVMANVIQTSAKEGFWETINPWADSFRQKVDASSRAISSVIASFTSSFSPMIERLFKMDIGDPKAAADKADTVMKMVSTIQSVVESLKGVKDLGVDKNIGSSFYETLVSLFGKPNNSGLGSGKGGVFSEGNIAVLNEGIMRIAMQPIDTAAIVQMKSNIGGWTDSISSALDGAAKLQKFNDVATGISMPVIADAPAVKVISAMVEEINALEDSLKKLGTPIDIDARLEALGDRLGLKNKEFKIQRSKDLTVSINLNVIMEADKVADAIIETKKVVSKGDKP